MISIARSTVSSGPCMKGQRVQKGRRKLSDRAIAGPKEVDGVVMGFPGTSRRNFVRQIVSPL